jgi:hypothetical protein
VKLIKEFFLMRELLSDIDVGWRENNRNRFILGEETKWGENMGRVGSIMG